jgi:hypothetical protein
MRKISLVLGFVNLVALSPLDFAQDQQYDDQQNFHYDTDEGPNSCFRV